MEHEFKPFDRVLVRDRDCDVWRCGIFSHTVTSAALRYICVGSHYGQCVPYEGNEHLLGTTNSPEPEHEYKWGDKVRVKVDGRVGVIVSEDIGKMVNVLLKGYRDAFVVCSLDEIEPCKDD